MTKFLGAFKNLGLKSYQFSTSLRAQNKPIALSVYRKLTYCP